MKKQDRAHLKLLSDVGEILSLLTGSSDITEFLQRVTTKLASHLNTAVCSIYLYDEKSDDIVLTTTVGLKASSVGVTRLRLEEGLVGKALRELKHIVLEKASLHPEFKYFPETGEDPYECFLAVPMRRGVERIGVLVLQREAPHKFTESEVHLVLALTSQLAGTLENARALLALQSGTIQPENRADKLPTFLQGKSVCPGVKSGPAYVFRRRASLIPEGAAKEGESVDLETAISATAKELTALQQQLANRLPEAASLISEAQLLMLTDPGFVGAMKAKVVEGAPPAQAVSDIARKYIRLFENSTHAYLREKASDVEDLALRILKNLFPLENDARSSYKNQVVVARDLFPSDILKLAAENVNAIVLVGGGTTSHVAILARSLQIPSIIIDFQELLQIRDGEFVLVDGENGHLYVNPEEETRRKYEKHIQTTEDISVLASKIQEETRTRDGIRVRLMSNINLLGELDLALQLKAEGIGLYRTEFPFLVRDTFPSCNDQLQIYRELFQRMAGREITIRTLDAGGDKMLSYFDTDGEPNPELGLCSIRLTLSHPEILEDQLKAILLARENQNRIRIMFPMIASPDEFLTAKEMVVQQWKKLPTETRGELPQIGMMLELPAVVDLMDEFVRIADFFSIGTNDFVQYMLAVDRSNERVADFYCPHHPAVLRGINRMVRPALAAGKDVSVCGEMAHDPKYLRFFVGIGIRKLSIDPNTIPEIQQCLATETCASMEKYAQDLLKCTSIREIENLIGA